MKLLFLHPNSWTGEYPILRKLAELGNEVCVLEESRSLDGAARRLTADFAEAGDGIRTLWYDPRRGAKRLLTWLPDRVFRKAFDGRNLAHRMWVIREAVAHFQPDAILCSDGFTYAIPAAFLRRLGLLGQRIVATYIGGDILDCPHADVGRRRTPMVSWLIRQSVQGVDVLRPLCESLERILLREGAPRDRVHVVPIQLGVPLDRLAALRARKEAISHELRTRYAIPAGAPLLVTLSGNQKGKGLHLLAAVWREVCAAVPGCHWLLCGPEDPWLTARVRPLLRESGFESCVRFTGRLTNDAVYEHLAAGDLHVNPTLCEGLNMVTVEAAAVGTPTITSDGAGIAAWVERLDTGKVVAADDANALRDAVIAALHDKALRLTWQERCPTMLADFSLDRIAEQLLGLLVPTHPSVVRVPR